MKCFVLIFVCELLCASTSSVIHSTAKTKAGTFRGIIDGNVTFNGTKNNVIAKFLGIPYAKPPIGSLRFRQPKKPEKLQHVYNATDFRPHCPQSISALQYVAQFKREEDCLYLNLYVPLQNRNFKKKVPVMIWLYGGGFRSGGADVYSGDILSAFHDVIVVTFNYRLGVFGFLSDGSLSTGNFGLWDQKLAIEWVNSNIESFGGDVDNVTLFGESAGGASVLFQALHAENSGLFQRIIAQSGSALAPWALQRNPYKIFSDYAQRLSCSVGSSEEKINCLRSKSVDELLEGVRPLEPFLPIIDGDFIIDDPETILDNQTESAIFAMSHFSDLDLLIGVNDEDGAHLFLTVWAQYLKTLFSVDVNKGVPKFVFETYFVPSMLKNLLDDSDPLVKRAVLFKYTDWTDEHDTFKVRSKMIDLTSDLLFFVPAVTTANKHSESTTSRATYFYEFAQKPWFAIKQPDWINGAIHTMEIPYVFGLPDSMKVIDDLPEHVTSNRPAEDIRLSSLMMKMWTNFAKTGFFHIERSWEQSIDTWAQKGYEVCSQLRNPNMPDLKSQGYPEWPLYESDHQPYFQFTHNISSHSIKHRLAAARVKLWTYLVSSLRTKCMEMEAGYNVQVKTDQNNSSTRLCLISLPYVLVVIVLISKYILYAE